ncbi:hypothetical protein J6590_023065 [Homalodisca vitripennis]|nr:hypothetical protein J6590_023065 [Homalodisca vitripennis]
METGHVTIAVTDQFDQKQERWQSQSFEDNRGPSSAETACGKAQDKDIVAASGYRNIGSSR